MHQPFEGYYTLWALFEDAVYGTIPAKIDDLSCSHRTYTGFLTFNNEDSCRRVFYALEDLFRPSGAEMPIGVPNPKWKPYFGGDRINENNGKFTINLEAPEAKKFEEKYLPILKPRIEVFPKRDISTYQTSRNRPIDEASNDPLVQAINTNGFRYALTGIYNSPSFFKSHMTIEDGKILVEALKAEGFAASVRNFDEFDKTPKEDSKKLYVLVHGHKDNKAPIFLTGQYNSELATILESIVIAHIECVNPQAKALYERSIAPEKSFARAI
jgi:hypothetical protein